jgi:tetratricopeptide (TPR) repeat protein
LARRQSEKAVLLDGPPLPYQNALEALDKIDVADKETKRNDIDLALASAYRKSSDYEQALELYSDMLGRESRVWYRAAILQGIGQCKQEQGKFDEAVTALERALSILGFNAPATVPMTYASIGKEALIQLVRRAFFGNNVRELEGQKRDYAEMRTNILTVLTKLYYFGKPEKIAWATIFNYNNALKVRSTSERWLKARLTTPTRAFRLGYDRHGPVRFENAGKVVAKSRSRTASSVYKSRTR